MVNKSITTLIPDIKYLFGGCDDVRPGELAGALSETIQHRFSEYKDRSDTHNVRLSMIGHPDRKIWYEVHDVKPDSALSPETLFKFLFGDMIEEVVLHLATVAGHNVSDRQLEVNIDGVSGHIDAIIDNWLIDVKSASSRSFEKFVSMKFLDDDPFGYTAQLPSYWQSDIIRAKNLDGAAFLVVDKTLAKMALVPLPLEILDGFDSSGRIWRVRELQESTTPPREFCYADVPDGTSGNMKLSAGCSYCDYKFQCRKGLRAFAYAGAPRYLTQVNKVPKVPEIDFFSSIEDN